MKNFEQKKPGFVYYMTLVFAIIGLLSFQNCSYIDRPMAQEKSAQK